MFNYIFFRILCKYFKNKIRIFYLCNFTDPDKNFALEVYGENSRCFDHTDQMWEEQTCRQIRQWQHWGSGCYRYSCHNGRLHILVREVSSYDEPSYWPANSDLSQEKYKI